MFGVVPRVLWERVCPPDELNRIRQQMNCVFIDTGKDKVLIETGIGEKWSDKETKMYAITRERPFADSLYATTGSRAEDITIVINTHLHFDHAGGNTVMAATTEDQKSSPSEPGGSHAVPQFPNARYLVSQSELDHAENPHERDRASYLSDNWRPMMASGQLEPVPDEYEHLPGLKLQTIRGHSETMQTWRLDRGGQTLYGFADLIPTSHHVPLPWIMGYDLYPTETLAFKKHILPLAAEKNWACLFYHDPEMPICRITISDRGFVAEPATFIG